MDRTEALFDLDKNLDEQHLDSILVEDVSEFFLMESTDFAASTSRSDA